MRKGPGLAALDRSLHSSQQYSSLGTELTSTQLASLRSQLDHFATSLRHFATQHRSEILANPQFRHAFQKMCSSIGVDPLASPIPSSSSRSGPGAKVAGLWNDLLGLADWQYQLGVQIIDVCVSTRHLNGGLIAMDDLIARVTRLRTGKDLPAAAGSSSSLSAAESSRSSSGGKKRNTHNTTNLISEEDVIRSIKTLAPLGCGYEVLQVGTKRMVRSIPRQLGTDTMVVLAILSLVPDPPASTLATTTSAMSSRSVDRDAAGLPYITEESLMLPRSAVAPSAAGAAVGKPTPSSPMGASPKPAWTRERARAVLDDMLLREGMLWVDHQAYPPRYYSLSVGTELDPNPT